MTSNPPYAQVLYDQHWMASLRNVVGDERARLVYGVDLMRGIARVDQGTGGGSPLAADNSPIFDAYAQTAAYVQSQWFGDNGERGLRGSARRARRRGRRRATRRRSAAFFACSGRARAAAQRRHGVSRADRGGAVLSRILQPESRSPSGRASATRRFVAPALVGRRSSSAGSRRADRT